MTLRSCVPLRTGTPFAETTRSPLRSPARSAGEPGSTRAITAPVVCERAHRLREIGGQVLDRHADAAALDLAVADQLVHHAARHVDRHGETDADIAAARRQDRGVDADALAVEVDQRPARIAGVDRGVGLDEILVALDAEPAAAERADDPRGHGLAQPERVADRQHEIADLQPVGIAERHRGQIVGRDLQHRDVGLRIAADQLCRETPVVLGRDLDLCRVLDDMTVGQNIAAARHRR